MSNVLLSDDNIFEEIHTFTAHWERDISGDCTDNVHDRGGITRNGVTLGFLKGLNDKSLADINKDGVIDKLDVMDADPAIAKQLFQHEFWNTAKAYCCPPYVAMAYYDFSVNSGYPRAAIELQKTIDELIPGTIVNYAGNIGPKTQHALKIFPTPHEDYQLATRYLQTRLTFVQNIAKKDSSQKANLNGWTNRIHALYKFLVNRYEYR